MFENKNIRVINIAETQANKKKWNEQKKIYQDENKTIQRDRSAIEKLIQTIDVSLAQQNPSSKQKSIQNLITKLEHLGQKSEINKTDNKYLQAQIKIDKTLDKVEKKISDSEVGIYVQDKIGQLLNSHAICKARNRCRVKKQTPIDADVINKELFPEIKEHRSSYYEKATIKEHRESLRNSN